jgi:tetratricopeptide (TPR) repeat protein
MAEQATETLDSAAALHALVRQALTAADAGATPEAERLAARVFREAPAGVLAAFVAQLGARWVDSFRGAVPEQTVAIVECDLEDLVAALATGGLEAAASLMAELLAWHPQTGAPDPAMPLLGAGLRVAIWGQPEAAAALPVETPTSPVPPAPPPTDAASGTPELTSATSATPAPIDAPLAPARLPVEAPGQIWVQRGLESLAVDPALALSCFELAINRSPEELAGWIGKGRALTALGRHDEALPTCVHLLKVEPRDGRHWWTYANGLAALGHLPEALKAFDRALVLTRDAPGLRAARDRLAAQLADNR